MKIAILIVALIGVTIIEAQDLYYYRYANDDEYYPNTYTRYKYVDYYPSTYTRSSGARASHPYPSSCPTGQTLVPVPAYTCGSSGYDTCTYACGTDPNYRYREAKVYRDYDYWYNSDSSRRGRVYVYDRDEPRRPVYVEREVNRNPIVIGHDSKISSKK